MPPTPGSQDTAPLDRVVAGRPWPASVVSGAEAGASAARNAGMAATGAPLVLFLGDDILPRPGLVAGHLEWHERSPEAEVAVLGHVDWAPELPRTAFMAWLDQGIQSDYPSIAGTDAGWGRMNTANLSLKRELFERAGGFDPRFPFLYKDLDLGRRMRDLGLRLLYNRGDAAHHLHEPTLDGWRRRMELVGAAERAFVERHPSERPYFHERFIAALASPPARGMTARLIRWVPRSFPLLGAARVVQRRPGLRPGAGTGVHGRLEQGMSAPVTVVVVSWNTRELLCACLESLRPDAEAGLADVWVVDNGSTDGSREAVSERFGWVTLECPDSNLGFGPAVNLVAARTEAPWLVAANADTAVAPGAIRALLDAGDGTRRRACLRRACCCPAARPSTRCTPSPASGSRCCLARCSGACPPRSETASYWRARGTPSASVASRGPTAPS